MSTLNPYFYAYNPELLAFENAWVNFVKKNDLNEAVIKPEIAESWRRCAMMDLNPLSVNAPPLIPESDLKKRLSANRGLLEIIRPFIDTLFDIVTSTGFRIDFADADGIVLLSVGDEDSQLLSRKTNTYPGAPRSESIAGTNSISLVLQNGKPVQVAGAQHYLQIFHITACSAAPVLSDSGQLLGVLNIAGRYELIHKHTLGMVAATAEAINNKIRILQINNQLIENNNQLRATLSIITDGVVYIKEGVITQLNQEMCNFLGKSAEKLIGRPVEGEIVTSPDLTRILAAQESYSDGELLLRGPNRNYKCLYFIRNVHDGQEENIGKVVMFTRVEEIQLLASKIKYAYAARYKFSDIVGKSPALQNAMDLAVRASEYDSRVIIEGESGTGKEMFAQAIHNNSRRKDGSFIAVDCGTVPIELLESQLFGYEGGAYTGAKKEGQAGIFERANTGTIFLDEIGNMPYEMQIKLLRVLQEGAFTRVGGTELIHTNVRIIAATNADLAEAVEKGTFREDLYYRLNVFYIKIPPLRERKDDIPLLVEHFLNTSKLRKRVIRVDKKALSAMTNYNWPGNIRQLNNAIERTLILTAGDTITIDALPAELIHDSTAELGLIVEEPLTLDAAMRKYTRYVLAANNNSVTKTARILGVSRSTVYKFMGE